MRKIFVICIYFLFIPLFVSAVSVDITATVPTPETTVIPSGGGGPVILGSLSAVLSASEALVKVLNITQTSAVISWTTNNAASTAVDYGPSLNYENGRATDGTNDLYVNHVVNLSNLSPGITYHFRVISKAANGVTYTSADYSFQTSPAPDTTAPANVTEFRATSGDGLATLVWTNPSDADFAGVLIRRSATIYPFIKSEGTKIYEGKEGAFVDTNVVNGKRYYYTIFSYDNFGNYSSGAITMAQPRIAQLPGLEVPPPTVPPTEEVPGAGIPLTPGVIFPTGEIPPTVPPVVTPVKQIKISDFSYIVHLPLGNLRLNPEDKEKFTVVKGSKITISVLAGKFIKSVRAMTVTMGNFSYLFNEDKKEGDFSATLIVPPVKGDYYITIVIIYNDGTTDTLRTDLLVDPYGVVFRKQKGPQGTTEEVHLSNALVVLYWHNPKTQVWELWPATSYNQTNPVLTNQSGEFSLFVPEGAYYLVAQKNGYRTYQSVPFEVINNIVNKDIELQPSTVITKVVDTIKNSGKQSLAIILSDGKKGAAIIKNSGKMIQKIMRIVHNFNAKNVHLIQKNWESVENLLVRIIQRIINLPKDFKNLFGRWL